MEKKLNTKRKRTSLTEKDPQGEEAVVHTINPRGAYLERKHTSWGGLNIYSVCGKPFIQYVKTRSIHFWQKKTSPLHDNGVFKRDIITKHQTFLWIHLFSHKQNQIRRNTLLLIFKPYHSTYSHPSNVFMRLLKFHALIILFSFSVFPLFIYRTYKPRWNVEFY